MEPKQHYTLKDFKRFAHKEFPDGFNTFRRVYTCNFENKTYLDAHNAAHCVSVLLVGNYHTRQRGPVVWAQATSTGMQYFKGNPRDSIITPIAEGPVNRIYYNLPYSKVVGQQEGRSRTPGRKAGHQIVETVINVLFLLAKRLERVENPDKTDMLSNFRFVCLSCGTEPEVQGGAYTAEVQQTGLPGTQTNRAHKKRKRSSDEYSHGIKQEEVADNETSVSERLRTQVPTVHCVPSPSLLQYEPASVTPQMSLSVSYSWHDVNGSTK